MNPQDMELDPRSQQLEAAWEYADRNFITASQADSS